MWPFGWARKRVVISVPILPPRAVIWSNIAARSIGVFPLKLSISRKQRVQRNGHSIRHKWDGFFRKVSVLLYNGSSTVVLTQHTDVIFIELYTFLHFYLPNILVSPW